MTRQECSDIISKLDKENYSFGSAMRYIRQKQGLTIRKVAKAVEKTPTYISDIERGNNKAPEKELMQQILAVLEIEGTQLQDHLYDLAAKERGKVSEDIAGYIMEHKDLRVVIRMTQQQKVGKEFWTECIKRMQ